MSHSSGVAGPAHRSLHPQPQCARARWVDLRGPWGFAYDDGDVGLQDAWYEREDVYTRIIMVPFPPEAPASGIGDPSFHPVVWYRRTFELMPVDADKLLILHCGAVDYRAQVWVNGRLVAMHEGGQTPFRADISHALQPAGEQVIVIRAEDQPADLGQPRGKQDWEEHPHQIWYHRTTGIWQPIWIEPVGSVYITDLQWGCDLERRTLRMAIAFRSPLAHPHPPVLSGSPDSVRPAEEGPGYRGKQERGSSQGDVSSNPPSPTRGRGVGGEGGPEVRVRVRLSLHGVNLVDELCIAEEQEVRREFALDSSQAMKPEQLLWSPDHPNLVNARISVLVGDDVVDEVQSYTGLRSVDIRGGRFLLNGLPVHLRFVLAQGYWPESHLAAPGDEALRREVQLAKELGFNGVRIHQKVEDPRFLYWCDRLGLMVWGEMANAYTFSRLSMARLTREWLEVLARDASHPCIVAWVPFNESWGVPNLRQEPAQRRFVEAICLLTRAYDPTRPVVANDGWEYLCGDVLGIHDYSFSGDVIRERYGSGEAIERTLRNVQHGGHSLMLVDRRDGDVPIMLTEFGGIGFRPDPDCASWFGYGTVTGDEAFYQKYRELVEAVLDCPDIAGFCYTQLTDTAQETNGLLTEHREPKLDPAAIAAIARNAPSHRQSS